MSTRKRTHAAVTERNRTNSAETSGRILVTKERLEALIRVRNTEEPPMMLQKVKEAIKDNLKNTGATNIDDNEV